MIGQSPFVEPASHWRSMAVSALRIAVRSATRGFDDVQLACSHGARVGTGPSLVELEHAGNLVQREAQHLRALDNSVSRQQRQQLGNAARAGVDSPSMG